MPNFCSVSLLVDGDKETLLKFCKDLIGKNPVIYNGGDTPNGLKERLEGKSKQEMIEEIKKFRAEQPDVVTYSNIAPMPDEYTISLPDEPSKWYDWRIDNWGVKWDIDFDIVEFSRIVKDLEDGAERDINISYSAPWWYPDGFLMHASKKYPNLTFTIWAEEPGSDLFIHKTYVNGESDVNFECDNYIVWKAYNEEDIYYVLEEFTNCDYSEDGLMEVMEDYPDSIDNLIEAINMLGGFKNQYASIIEFFDLENFGEQSIKIIDTLEDKLRCLDGAK